MTFDGFCVCGNISTVCIKLIDKIIMTDNCDRLICESVFGGFLMNYPYRNLYRDIIPHFVLIQMGEAEPKDFPIATREEMEALWDAEEDEVMQEKFRM